MPVNMKTLPLDRRYETFSYLPPLTDQQIEKQLNYCLQMGYIPGVEFNASSNPEEFYWTMWKLPLFGASSTRAVLDEVQACRSEYGNCFIRVVGFDNVKQCQAVSFVVHKPGSNNSGSSFRY